MHRLDWRPYHVDVYVTSLVTYCHEAISANLDAFNLVVSPSESSTMFVPISFQGIAMLHVHPGITMQSFAVFQLLGYDYLNSRCVFDCVS